MATFRYVRGAVLDLTNYLTTNLNGFIDTISTEEGYSPALIHPVAYRDFVHPFPTETLVVEVEGPTWGSIDLHNRYWHVECVVHIVFRSPDGNVQAAQEMIRSFTSALIRCLMADNTLAGQDVTCDILDGEIAGVSKEGRLSMVSSTRCQVRREEP